MATVDQVVPSMNCGQKPHTALKLINLLKFIMCFNIRFQTVSNSDILILGRFW